MYNMNNHIHVHVHKYIYNVYMYMYTDKYLVGDFLSSSALLSISLSETCISTMTTGIILCLVSRSTWDLVSGHPSRTKLHVHVCHISKSSMLRRICLCTCTHVLENLGFVSYSFSVHVLYHEQQFLSNVRCIYTCITLFIHSMYMYIYTCTCTCMCTMKLTLW